MKYRVRFNKIGQKSAFEFDRNFKTKAQAQKFANRNKRMTKDFRQIFFLPNKPTPQQIRRLNPKKRDKEILIRRRFRIVKG